MRRNCRRPDRVALGATHTMVLRSLLIAVLLVLLPASLRAEDEPAASPADLRKRVVAWLEDLSSDSFRVREAARAGLQREGLRARDLLEAAAQHDDPEVRRTVEAILARGPQVKREPVADVAPGDFDGLGRLDLDLQDVPLRTALDDLGAQMGGHVRWTPKGEGPRITLKARGLPCFEALARVLAEAKLHMPKPFDAEGNGHPLEIGRLPHVPWAAAGPLRVRLQEITATRSFEKEAPPRYLVRLRLDWAPFVQLVQYETPRITSVVDPDGKPFLPTPTMSRSVRRGVSARSRSATLDLHLMPGKQPTKPTIGVLEFTLPLTLRYDVAEVALADLTKIPLTVGADGKPRPADQDGAVTFHSFDEQEHGQWILDYGARLDGDVAQRSVQAYVREAKGGVTQMYVAGGRSRSADGNVRVTARAYRRNQPAPAGLVVRWFQREEPGEVRFRLEQIPLR